MTPSVGDVLFFHGYGDTFKNHLPLFREWNQAGLRVIAFDFPSHGQTQGDKWDDLDWYSFSDLAEMASVVRKQAVKGQDRPLFLSGWSLGGLLATKIVQSHELRTLFPPIKGLVTFAPGVSVKKCVGNIFCQITNETLTHNETLFGRFLYPRSPFDRVNFGMKLLYNASLTWNRGIPSEIPTLVFVASESKDHYVITKQLKKWVHLQRNAFSSSLLAFQCPDAYHELDNEPNAYGGSQVRILSRHFIQATYQGEDLKMAHGPCYSF